MQNIFGRKGESMDFIFEAYGVPFLGYVVVCALAYPIFWKLGHTSKRFWSNLWLFFLGPIILLMHMFALVVDRHAKKMRFQKH